MSALSSKKCVPCEGGVPAFTEAQIKEYLPQIDPAWRHFQEGGFDKIARDFKFADFSQAMRFVNAVAVLAESENHHPDIHIWYSKVQLVLWTHAVKGLSENDFILAAKIDFLPEDRQ